MIVCHEKCYVCDEVVDFWIEDSGTLFREAICLNCHSSLRHSDVAKKISEIYFAGKPLAMIHTSNETLTLLNTTPYGGIHECLKHLPNYYCSEFFPDIPSGEKNSDGILSVDLCDIPFNDHFFDLIITEDVLEHIQNYEQAFAEISRVLKTGGRHIFTIPIKETGPTRALVPQFSVYHPAPFNQQAVVYNEFGLDVSSIAEKYDTHTHLVEGHRFYLANETTDLVKEYDDYLLKKDQPLSFFRYNSLFFISEKKKSMIDDGERLILGGNCGIDTEIEHLHRYSVACEVSKNKIVLDAACGTGYGSFMMAKSAQKVVGIDIAEEAVEYAKLHYTMDNLEYLQMPAENLNFLNESFDLVTSFETFEHISSNNQKLFLREIKQILKKDGMLLISLPNDELEKELSGGEYENPYHIGNMNPEKFKRLLSEYFNSVVFYLQNNIMSSSLLKESDLPTSVSCYFGGRVEKGGFLIAVCSDKSCILPCLESIYIPDIFNYYQRKLPVFNASVYVDYGNDFSESSRVWSTCRRSNNEFYYQFNLSAFRNIRRIRFDPCETGCKVKLTSVTLDSMNVGFSSNNSDTIEDDYDVFWTIDPYYILEVTLQKIGLLEVKGILTVINPNQVFYKQQEKIDHVTRDFMAAKNGLAEVQIVQEQLQQRSVELEILQKQFWGRTTELDTLKVQLQERDKELDNVQEQLQDRMIELGNVQNQLQDKTIELGSVQEQLHDGTIELSNVQEQLQDRTVELRDVQEQLREQTLYLTQVQEKLISKEFDLQNLQKLMQEQTLNLNRLQDELDEQVNKNLDIEKQLHEITNYNLQIVIQYQTVLNSTCWKITKPLRFILDFLKKWGK